MKKTVRFAALVAGSILVPAVASYAGTWVPEWGLDSSATYDDNFFMDQTEQGTWRYSIKPELSLHYLTPAVESSLQASVAARRYSEFDEFNTTDPSIQWDNSVSGQRSIWTLNFGYQENSQRDFAELDTGQFNSNTVVETLNVEPGVSYQLSEKDTLGLSFGYIERNYDQPDFADNENSSATLSWQHQINQRWTTDISGTASKYEAERAGVNHTETDYENLTAALIYQATESMLINVSIGYFNSDQHRVQLVGPVVSDEENSGALASLGISSDEQVNDWSINLSRGLYPSSQGEIEERDSVHFSYERQLSERSSAGLRAEWADTESDINPRENTSISPFYSYRLTPKLKLETSYQFRTFDRVTGDVESNRIKAGLRYSF
jgi:hypothetical protein